MQKNTGIFCKNAKFIGYFLHLTIFMKTKYIAVDIKFRLVSKAHNLNKLVEDIKAKNNISFFSRKFQDHKHLIYVNKNDEILHIYKL